MTIFSKPTAADTDIPGSPGIEIVHRTEEGDVQAASADSFSDNGSDRYNEASPNHTAASSKQGTSIWRDIRTYTIGGAALGAVFVAGRASKTVGAPATYTNVAKAKNNGSKSKVGKSGKVFSSTIIGRISTDTSSACAIEVSQVAAADIAACSRYWAGPTASNGGVGYGSTCSDTATYNSVQGGTDNGNVPSLADNTCLGMGDAPSCYDIEGVNDGAPVKVRVSAAWDWSAYNTPATLPPPGTCAESDLVLDADTNTCARVLSNPSIPLTRKGGTTGWCFDATKLPTIDYNPDDFVTNVQSITSTVTITVDDTDYVCNITGEYE
jgi:hypothetical protein